ncbi:MAG: flagella synthesis protein FlgN [Nitrospiria bacterium]
MRLLKVLEEMIPSHQQLLTLLQNEKRHIIEGAVEKLVQCSIDKEKVLYDLNGLNRQRIDLLQQLNHPNPPQTLNALLPGCSEKHRRRLRDVQAKLEALTASIHEINQMNGILVERVLGQISSLLGLFKQMCRETPVYQQTGVIHHPPKHGRTIGKV